MSDSEDADRHTQIFPAVFETMIRADPTSRARMPFDPARMQTLREHHALVSLVSSAAGDDGSGLVDDGRGPTRLPAFVTPTGCRTSTRSPTANAKSTWPAKRTFSRPTPRTCRRSPCATSRPPSPARHARPATANRARTTPAASPRRPSAARPSALRDVEPKPERRQRRRPTEDRRAAGRGQDGYFKTGWEADKGFGVPARVFSGVSLEDPREVLTVGFVGVEPEDLAAGLEQVADQEKTRHVKIDDVIESTELSAMYALVSEHDFSEIPREISIGTTDSLLSALQTQAQTTPQPHGGAPPWGAWAQAALLARRRGCSASG
jgi:hypothetical protein